MRAYPARQPRSNAGRPEQVSTLRNRNLTRNRNRRFLSRPDDGRVRLGLRLRKRKRTGLFGGYEKRLCRRATGASRQNAQASHNDPQHSLAGDLLVNDGSDGHCRRSSRPACHESRNSTRRRDQRHHVVHRAGGGCPPADNCRALPPKNYLTTASPVVRIPRVPPDSRLGSVHRV